MIEFRRQTLKNGLVVLVHEDPSTPLVACNLLYRVGSRDEDPERTGLAHLFEHLMFSGTPEVPDFDQPIQEAGGENNAYTNTDVTCFYEVLPAQNLEVALWLESDRMRNLKVDEQKLRVQQKVVVEEFKEVCLNQPYGDAWHHLSELAFRVHPYRWPTIGKEPAHILGVRLEEVRAFYRRFYAPNNAVLVIAGGVDAAEALKLAEKWFGNIPPSNLSPRTLPQEPPQTALQRRIQRAKVPEEALYLAFRTGSRLDTDFHATDLLSDVLCNGPSSRLYRRLEKERRLFQSIDCYITGSFDPGLLIIEGQISEGTSLETARSAVWEEIERLKEEPVPARELEKLKNKVESNLVFSETSVTSKASSLAFYEALGDAALVNREAENYRRVEPADLQAVARRIFRPENCAELQYRKEEA